MSRAKKLAATEGSDATAGQPARPHPGGATGKAGFSRARCRDQPRNHVTRSCKRGTFDHVKGSSLDTPSRGARHVFAFKGMLLVEATSEGGQLDAPRTNPCVYTELHSDE